MPQLDDPKRGVGLLLTSAFLKVLCGKPHLRSTLFRKRCYKICQYLIKDFRLIDEEGMRGIIDDFDRQARPTLSNFLGSGFGPVQCGKYQEYGTIKPVDYGSQIVRPEKVPVSRAHGDGIGGHREHGFGERIHIFRLRVYMNRLDKVASEGLPVPLHSRDPIGNEVSIGLQYNVPVHHDHGVHHIRADFVRTEKYMLSSNRPADEDDRFIVKVIEQLANVSA